MNITITEETLINAIKISWKASHTFMRQCDSHMAVHCWRYAQAELDGMWTLLNYSDGDDVTDLNDSIVLLRAIANRHQIDSYYLDAAA